jgi:hypothetical protein
VALVTCAGADVLSGAIHFPRRGGWLARLVLDTPRLPAGRVTIAAANGLSATGTVIPGGGVFLDSSHVLVAGGAGGLGAMVSPAAYQGASLSDPLNAVLQAGGESLSTSVASSVTGVQLATWTVTATTVSRALDELCGAASDALDELIGWRVLDDGTVWLGAESWPSKKLPAGSDVLEVFPSEGRYVIGCATPALLPGVAIDGVGNVGAVDHWLRSSEIRSWLWV